MTRALCKTGGANGSQVRNAGLAQVWLTASITEEALGDQLGRMTWPLDISQPLSLVTSVLAGSKRVCLRRELKDNS